MIKASAVLERVIQLGQERPRTLNECRYVNDDGTPCCIVGTALIDLGMKPEAFLEDDELNRWSSVRELFSMYASDLGLADDLETDDMRALALTQGRQDEGWEWGDATAHLR